MPEVSASAREVAARVQALMWAGAALLAGLSEFLPHSATGSRPAMAVLAAVALIVAIAFALARERVSTGVLLAGNLMAVVGSCLAVLIDGDATSTTQIVLLWPALFAAYFFSARALACHLVLIVSGYVAVTFAMGMQGVAELRISNTCGAVIGVALIMWILRSRLERAIVELHTAAATDTLTSLMNRRGFEQELDRVLAECAEAGQPLSVLLGDLDHFKTVNDLHGHEVGDRVLLRVAVSMSGGLRDQDFVARIGGEEFAVVLPGAPEVEGRAIAERLRRMVAGSHDEVAGGMTISFGLATYPAAANDRIGLLRAADHALYSAKRAGRDQVLAATSQQMQATAGT